MKVCICGSRSISDFDLVYAFIAFCPINYSKFIVGGAGGVDQIAEKIGRVLGIETVVFKPDWNKHGKRAGILRNIEMVDACDAVIAIHDGISKGTQFTIDYAQKKGKQLFVKIVPAEQPLSKREPSRG